MVSHAGVALVVEVADRAGLTRVVGSAGRHEGAALGARPRWVVRDVAVMLADDGDCVTDIDAYVRGHEILPMGGHREYPRPAANSPHWRPRISPPVLS
jgi:hypothetical protein